jgi:hypothetical protein
MRKQHQDNTLLSPFFQRERPLKSSRRPGHPGIEGSSGPDTSLLLCPLHPYFHRQSNTRSDTIRLGVLYRSTETTTRRKRKGPWESARSVPRPGPSARFSEPPSTDLDSWTKKQSTCPRYHHRTLPPPAGRLPSVKSLGIPCQKIFVQGSQFPDHFCLFFFFFFRSCPLITSHLPDTPVSMIGEGCVAGASRCGRLTTDAAGPGIEARLACDFLRIGDIPLHATHQHAPHQAENSHTKAIPRLAGRIAHSIQASHIFVTARRQTKKQANVSATQVRDFTGLSRCNVLGIPQSIGRIVDHR